MTMAEVRGKRFGILGAARSGRAAAALLRRAGAEVFVSDRSAASAMTEARQELEHLGVDFEFGHNSDRVVAVDTLVVSPGVPSNAPPVVSALARGVTVVSELELASWFCPCPIVAITGTNGKTTTTTLTARLLQDAGLPTLVAGNIGTAFSQVVGAAKPDSVVVLEVSSFQLDHIRSFRPAVALLLNITPDHLDRYEHSFALYSDAKTRVFMNQRVGDVLVYNADDPETARQVAAHAPKGVELLPFSIRKPLQTGAYVDGGALTVARRGTREQIIERSAIGIPGDHNLANAMAAVLAATVRGVSGEIQRKTLSTFAGVEHRLEFVRDVAGIRYVNDSKGTNVDSVWYALQSYSTPIVLLLGGRDKGNDYSRLQELVKKHVRAIVAIGESADNVRAAFETVVPVERAGSMQEAVMAARRVAQRGDTVLLSPACASFDWFANYEERGRVFKEIVRGLPEDE